MIPAPVAPDHFQDVIALTVHRAGASHLLVTLTHHDRILLTFDFGALTREHDGYRLLNNALVTWAARTIRYVVDGTVPEP